MQTIKNLLSAAVKENASDLFIHSGKKPAFRKNGTLVTRNDIISRECIEKFRQSLLLPAEEEVYLSKHSFDTSCTEGGERFRINFFDTFHGPAMAVRPVKRGNELSFDSLKLPVTFLEDLCRARRGLILVCGSTGSGKSTTVAAMINHINKNFCRHILTLEDPVEYLFDDEQSRISQRETGSEDGAFIQALRSALRENPDVIVIGEMRDLESMQTAVSAAMTGHLVLATVHTADTIRTVERIVAMFPENIREQASADTAQALNAIIAQRLIPRKEGKGLIPAVELLPATPTVKKLIAEVQSVPSHSCIVPAYTATMPESVTLATGCDALAHLLEGFLNVGADSSNSNANVWAMRGIRLVKEYLPEAMKNDPEARKQMAVAAALGGMTIRFKSTGLPHLCSFSWFGRIAHGIAAIMLLPESWRYYLGNPAVASRTMELAEIFPGRTPEEIITSFRKFLTGLGVPQFLKEFPDLSLELMERTASSAGENKMKLELAPRPVPLEQSKFVLQEILFKSYGE